MPYQLAHSLHKRMLHFLTTPYLKGHKMKTTLLAAALLIFGLSGAAYAKCNGGGMPMNSGDGQ